MTNHPNAHAGLEALRHAEGATDVTGPHAGSQPVARMILAAPFTLIASSKAATRTHRVPLAGGRRRHTVFFAATSPDVVTRRPRRRTAQRRAWLPLYCQSTLPVPLPLPVPLTAEVVSANIRVAWAIASDIRSSVASSMLVMSSQAAW